MTPKRPRPGRWCSSRCWPGRCCPCSALGAGLAGTAYLARRFGTLPVYRASVIAFTAASALCALAPDAGVLVGARIVKGLVAAPLVPLAMSMLLGRDAARSRAISPAAGILLFLGPALGPTAGGALAAGLAMAPQGLITGLSAALAPRWLTRLTVRATVLAGFTVLAVASLGLLLIGAATPLWLIAALLACRSAAVGLVITTPHHPHLLWVHEHLQQLSSHARVITDPASHVAEQRRLPWWR